MEQINCEICGGHYSNSNYKSRHENTQKHKNAENQILLKLDTPEALQIYNQNKKIAEMQDIISEFRILHHILSN